MKFLVGQIKSVCRMKENIESRNVNFRFYYNYVLKFNSVLFRFIDL